jgi:hypothetical protein
MNATFLAPQPRARQAGISQHHSGVRKTYRSPVIDARLFYDAADGRKWMRRCEQKRAVWIAFLDISHGQTNVMATEDQIARLKRIPRRTVRWVIRLLRTQGFLRDVRKHGLRDAMERELLPARLGTHQPPVGESCRTSTPESCRTRTGESCRVNAVKRVQQTDSKSSSEKPAATPDDDHSLASLRAKAENILVKQNAPLLVELALDRIEMRIVQQGISVGSHRYFLKSFQKLLADDREYREVFAEFEYVAGLRESKQPEFSSERV